MKGILGLDLGTNSIGWAIRDINPELENQIIDKEVLTLAVCSIGLLVFLSSITYSLLVNNACSKNNYAFGVN